MGKGKAPTETTSVQTRITGMAEPYYKRLIADAESIYNPMAEYQSYEGPRLAKMGPDQYQAYQMTRNIAGSNVAGLPEAMGVTAGNIAGGQRIAATASPYQFAGTGFNAADTSAGNLGEAEMFTPQAVQRYMSPYMENVLGRQMNEARRQFDIGQGARDTQAVQAGAFGGSRSGVQQALAEEGMQRQLGDIYGTGMQTAYQDAQQAFQADRAARMGREAEQVAERARAQELGAGEAGRVQAGMAGEAARMQESQAAENARARQEQLQAMGFSSEQAMQLAGLGEKERAAGVQGAQLLEAAGQAEEARRQAGLDVAYQDFLRQEAFPMQQLQGMSSILQGIPAETEQMRTAYAPSNPLQQIAGTGLAAIGAYKGLQG